MSRTLSLVSVVSTGGGGGGAGSTTGAGGGVCAASWAAAAFSPARFFTNQMPPPPASRITTRAAIPIIILEFDEDCAAGALGAATAEAWVLGPREAGPPLMEAEGGGSIPDSRVVYRDPESDSRFSKESAAWISF